MKIKQFPLPEEQLATLGSHQWSVARLFKLSEKFHVMDIPIDHLNIYHKYESMTLREMVMHMKAVQDANLDYPIILDEDGDLMDGRHRIMKALLEGKETIKAVRFDENPHPCKIVETD